MATATKWNATKHQPTTEEIATRLGRWSVEYILTEWARSATGSPLSFRSTYAVTFHSEDGRRVQFTTLGSLTRGEIISTALWSERCNESETIVTRVDDGSDMDAFSAWNADEEEWGPDSATQMLERGPR